MHTITQFQENSKPILLIILAGQNNLANLLIYRTSLPLAFRQGRGQKPSGRHLPLEHAGLPPAPPQNRRRQIESLL
ncbi:hypothetical protein DFAR_2120009 [Desulfarculales bacterium]